MGPDKTARLEGSLTIRSGGYGLRGVRSRPKSAMLRFEPDQYGSGFLCLSCLPTRKMPAAGNFGRTDDVVQIGFGWRTHCWCGDKLLAQSLGLPTWPSTLRCIGDTGNENGKCRPAAPALQREQGPSSHVFMTERDGPMTPKALHALFGRIGARAKMQFPVHPHMLRHGCSYALANVTSLSWAQEHPAHGALHGAFAR
jgi:Phage integrase family